jgi:hypothetical protein
MRSISGYKNLIPSEVEGSKHMIISSQCERIFRFQNFASSLEKFFLENLWTRTGFGGKYCLSQTKTKKWRAKRASLFFPETFGSFWSQKERRESWINESSLSYDCAEIVLLYFHRLTRVFLWFIRWAMHLHFDYNSLDLLSHCTR